MGHIKIQNLTKQYPNRRNNLRVNDTETYKRNNKVLDNVNLEFQDGEMVCILGPSGCGKSTLLHIIAGFEQASSGMVLIDQQPVTKPSSDYIFVFQKNGLLPWMTVWQNVELGLRHLENIEEKEDTIREYISMVELEGFESYYPHQLSGGMQRRAELARAIVTNPELLILDEPFSGLDFLTHLKMREEVVNMHHFIEKTIVIVTHDIDDALLMADRVIVMGSSPHNVILDRQLDFKHPRYIEKVEGLRELRDELYLMLGVNYAV